MYFDLAGKLTSMLVSWTDAAPYDRFLDVSAGRSWFRTDDLLELSELLNTVQCEWKRAKGGVR